MDLLVNAEVKPTRIGMGTAGFGADVDQRTSWAALDAYAEAGGNFVDTAHIYAAWIEDGWGKSERTVGEWLRVNGNRNEIVLATKGGHPPMDHMERGRCGRADLEQDLGESLERLRVDHVDVYWLHRDDPERPVGEIVEVVSEWVADGRIGAYGVSNWTAARLDTAWEYAREHGLRELSASQPGYAFAFHPTAANECSPMRYMDEESHAWHVRTQVPVAAYSAQATGFFGEANVAWASGGFPGKAPAAGGYDMADNRDRLTRAINMAGRKDVTASQIAVAYLCHQPFRVYPIIGTKQPERIREAIAATDIALSGEDMAYLESAEGRPPIVAPRST